MLFQPFGLVHLITCSGIVFCTQKCLVHFFGFLYFIFYILSSYLEQLLASDWSNVTVSKQVSCFIGFLKLVPYVILGRVVDSYMTSFLLRGWTFLNLSKRIVSKTECCIRKYLSTRSEKRTDFALYCYSHGLTFNWMLRWICSILLISNDHLGRSHLLLRKQNGYVAA